TQPTVDEHLRNTVGEYVFQPCSTNGGLVERIGVGEGISFPCERVGITIQHSSACVLVARPLLSGIDVAHRHAAAEINEVGSMPARAQSINEFATLPKSRSTICCSVAMEVDMQADDSDTRSKNGEMLSTLRRSLTKTSRRQQTR